MYLARFDDPAGVRFGVPTFNYRHAPAGLATRRQLAAKGLTPGRQPIAGQILWRRGKRVAYLYREDRAVPKREATDAQLAALLKAWAALSTCPTCGREYPYYLPRRFGECADCHETAATAPTEGSR
ncbi:RRQRL motif-containing zinc-binding protein [Glycomyces xiaoerkulensis]|uniref:RRQRL motif-containing zinc-binding protein n=1 Tax=Glycomyces xiaoerkulensis TaxID=2038139 RepID=UPI000C258AD4|nr:RRQRL motif-containing zinc-binding protein [Glycomyces xiaoerkulensis]